MSNKKLILVIEDEPDILELVEMVLRQDYDVVLASDGESGVNWAEKLSFDLIITDVSMPGKIDGFEIHRRFCNQVPIMLMSGYANFSDAEMEEFKMIQKPMDLIEMKKKVDLLLNVA